MDRSSGTTQEYPSAAKRKRSGSPEPPHLSAPPVKVAKMHANHLQINYLARQHQEILPLISPDDPLPSLLALIAEYDGVLQRHESMAGNLGARPLGPILIKRFERLFDGPPRVLKSHGKEGNTVGWLDVVEFAKNKPDQFNLEKSRDGLRVCQFYTKQSRVEITEEDYELIASGMPQKLIPPQPIVEDEEKELGTLEILDKHLSQVVQLADQVSARARQLNHRLKNRRNAILGRREAEALWPDHRKSAHAHHAARGSDPGPMSGAANGDRDRHSSASPLSGFVAVNAKPPAATADAASHDGYPYDPSRTAPIAAVNGTSVHGASAAVRAELLGKFLTHSELAASGDHEHGRRASISTARPAGGSSRSRGKPTSDAAEYAGLMNSASPVPIPHTPTALLPYVKPVPAERYDDNGPYKAEMVARMEQLQRGDRIQPPCDRCRRLHMDCRKNLTACMGCTKKHAKCSWKDVLEDELRDHPDRAGSSGDENGLDGSSDREGYRHLPVLTHDHAAKRAYPRDDHIGVRDEELLGEDPSGDEDGDLMPMKMEAAGSSPESHPVQIAGAERLGPSSDASESPNADPERGPVLPDVKPIMDGMHHDHALGFRNVNGIVAEAIGSGKADRGNGGEGEENDARLQMNMAAQEMMMPSAPKEVAVYGPSAFAAVSTTETVRT